jgi:hypothetical protein
MLHDKLMEYEERASRGASGLDERSRGASRFERQTTHDGRAATEDEPTLVRDQAAHDQMVRDQGAHDQAERDQRASDARPEIEDIVRIDLPRPGQMVLWRHDWPGLHALTPDVLPAQVLDPRPALMPRPDRAPEDWEALPDRAPAGHVRLLAHDAGGDVLVVTHSPVLAQGGAGIEDIEMGRGYSELPLVPYGEDDEIPGRPALGCWCYADNEEFVDVVWVPRRQRVTT